MNASFASIVIGLVLLAAPALANAQQELDEIGTNIGIVDQPIAIGFQPITLFVLHEPALGFVKQYRAAAVPFQPNSRDGSSDRKLFVGAPVPFGSANMKHNRFHFTFFMASRDAAFAATEVKQWDAKTLEENSQNLKELQSGIATLEEGLAIARRKQISFEAKLAQLREEASKIARVDEIVELKNQVENILSSEKKREKEIARITKLVELGRSASDPEDIDQMRQELSIHLLEAAKVTSITDRLNRRRRNAALQSFLKKIDLVKKTQATNPAPLAQEILKLRKRRRELESRLGITSGDSTTDEF